MPNNAMYIRCGYCGELLYLAKYFPSGGWRRYNDPLPITDNKNSESWLRKHTHNQITNDGPCHFSIVYDSEICDNASKLGVDRLITREMTAGARRILLEKTEEPDE